MVARTRAEIERIWTGVDSIKKLTDRVIGFGPLNLGLDSILTWVPVVGPMFSIGVASYLLVQAVRARASTGTTVRMIGYVLADTITDAVPVAGDVIDMIFPGHLMAAKALQKEIESTHWIEDTYANAKATGAHEHHMAHVRATKGMKRVIYLHDR